MLSPTDGKCSVESSLLHCCVCNNVPLNTASLFNSQNSSTATTLPMITGSSLASATSSPSLTHIPALPTVENSLAQQAQPRGALAALIFVLIIKLC